MNIKILENKQIYITPYSDLSQQIYEELSKKLSRFNFLGFIDQNKKNDKIVKPKKKQNSVIVVVSPKYTDKIVEDLKKINIPFIYTLIKNHSIVYYNNKKAYDQALDKYLNEVEKQNLNLLVNSFLKDSWLKTNKNVHNNKRCFILATGPSLNKTDISKLKNEFTIGVNGIYKLADKINLDYFIYVSNWYWKNHIEGLKNISCQRRFLPYELKNELNSLTPTSWININRPLYYSKEGYPIKVPRNFSLTPELYFEAGGTVIFLALQLAYFLGFKEVIILGLDHSYKKDDYKNTTHKGYHYSTNGGDNSHFEPNYSPEGIQVHVDLDAMERGYSMAKTIFENDNRKILNASPGTKLGVFKKVKYETLF